MKSSVAAVCTGVALALSACKREQLPAAAEAEAKAALPVSFASNQLSGVRAPQIAPDRDISLVRTHAAMEAVSLAQQRLFKETGAWLTQESIEQHAHVIFTAISEDILGHPYRPRDDRGRAFFGELNRAGYHLYLSQMSVENEPYLCAVLFSLGEPRDSSELAEVKRDLKMNDSTAKMRQLRAVAATAESEQLYGSAGADGNIFVNPSLMLQDQTADERSLPVMFKGVLANELGHLKLRTAEARGRAPTTSNQAEEAFSDFCTLAITPPQEIFYSVLDILSSTTLRYALSKQCAVAGAREFGRANVPGFDPEMKGDSIDKLVAYLNDASNLTALPIFKSTLLAAYQRMLTAQGVPEELFDVQP